MLREAPEAIFPTLDRGSGFWGDFDYFICIYQASVIFAEAAPRQISIISVLFFQEHLFQEALCVHRTATYFQEAFF